MPSDKDRERRKRYTSRMCSLGFKSAASPSCYKKRLAYSIKWNKAHRKQCRLAEERYRAKLKAAKGQITYFSRYLWAAEKQLLNAKLKKERTHAAYKTMLQLLKLWPRIHNRRYHIKNLHSHALRPTRSSKL